MSCPALLSDWNERKKQVTPGQSRKRKRSSLSSRNCKLNSSAYCVTDSPGNLLGSFSGVPSKRAPKKALTTKTKAPSSVVKSEEKRLSFGSSSQKINAHNVASPIAFEDGNGGRSTYANLLKENENLKRQLQSERTLREALEKQIRERIEKCEGLKKEIALIKFNQQLAGIRSSACVVPSSTDSSSDDSEE